MARVIDYSYGKQVTASDADEDGAARSCAEGPDTIFHVIGPSTGDVHDGDASNEATGREREDGHGTHERTGAITSPWTEPLREVGDAGEQATQWAAEAAERTREMAGRVAERVTETAGTVGERLREAAGAGSRTARTAGQTAGRSTKKALQDPTVRAALNAGAAIIGQHVATAVVKYVKSRAK